MSGLLQNFWISLRRLQFHDTEELKMIDTRYRKKTDPISYSDMSNKPSINGVELVGNKKASDLKLSMEVSSIMVPSADLVGTIIHYVGETGNGFTHNYFYECVADTSATPTTYSWVNRPTQEDSSGHVIENNAGTQLTQRAGLQFKDVDVSDDQTNNKTIIDVSGKENKFRFDTMPTASADYAGKTVQYIGATGNGYIHNYYYECMTDTTTVPYTYTWEPVNVQIGGHTVENGAGTSMTERAGLQFKGAKVTDDQPNDRTVVETIDPEAVAPEFDPTDTYTTGERVTKDGKLYVFTDDHTGAWDAADVEETDIDSELPTPMSASDLEDVVDAFNPTHTNAWNQVVIDERGTEYVVGTWVNSNGTKQPLYEAVFKGTTPSSNAVINLASANNRSRCHMVWGYYTDASGYNADLNYDEMVAGYGIACSVKSDGTQASFSVGGNSKNRPFIICVRYTKTTDTAQ